MRISTTIDADRLSECRRRLGVSDSRLLDRALVALLDALEAEREHQALEAMPYDTDPEIAWEVPAGPDLPYDGDIPADVQELSRLRRRR